MSGVIHRDVISRTTEHTGQFKTVHLMRDARVDAQTLQRRLDAKNVLAHMETVLSGFEAVGITSQSRFARQLPY